VDVILAVGFLAQVRKVAVELGDTLQHRVGTIAQKAAILRVLVLPPVEKGDLRLRAEDVAHLRERAAAAQNADGHAAQPLNGIDFSRAERGLRQS